MREKIGVVTTRNEIKKTARVDFGNHTSLEMPCINNFPRIGKKVLVSYSETGKGYILGEVYTGE